MKINESIYSAVRVWTQRCFIDDSSLFGENEVWTPGVIDEFKVLFVDSAIKGKGDFFIKFERQLESGTVEAKQLAAEMLWLLHLFPSNVGRARKKDQIRRVWGWSGQPFPELARVQVAYEPGIGSAGRAFSTLRWLELTFLYRLSAAAKELSVVERQQLLADPWEFARFVDGIEGAAQRQLRHILLNLVFPDTFERISTTSHKRSIVDAFSQDSEIEFPEPNTPMLGDLDLDWKLAHIRNFFADKTGRDDLDFYTPPLSSKWSFGDLTSTAQVAEFREKLEANSDLLWERFRSQAADFRDFEEPGEWLSEQELDYKHKALEAVAEGIDALGIEDKPDEDQAVYLLDVIKSGNTNIVDYRAWDKTFGDAPNTIHSTVDACWDFAHDAITYQHFFNRLKEAGVKPTWDGLSFVLWCLNPDKFFPVKISHYRKLGEELGIKFKKRDAPSASSFGGMMAFGQAFREFLSESKPRDWIDVQSFIWVCCRSGYGAPFDRLFALGEADDILNDFEAVIETLEQASGYNADNLSVSIPDAQTPRIRLTINYGAWQVFSYLTQGSEKGFGLAVSKSGVYGDFLEEGQMFDREISAGRFGIHFVNEDDYWEMEEEVWEEYLSGLEAIVSAFEVQKSSAYLRYHVPQLYVLITSEKERPKILKSGLDLTLRLGQPSSIVAEDPPDAVTGEGKFWWLNANPKVWDFNSMPVGTTQIYTAYNDNGHKRQKFKHFEAIRPGDQIVGYLTTPTKAIVSFCVVTKGMAETDGVGFEFRKLEDLRNPIHWAELQAYSELAECEPIVSNQGSLFTLSAPEFEFIRSIADERLPAEQIKPYSRENALSELFLRDEKFDQMCTLLAHKKNLILQGAPGVGKTFVARRLAYTLMKRQDKDRAQMIQFHQSYAYEDFIQGYRPDGKGGFRLKNGTFYTFCLRAQRDPGNDYFLVIDEINRGNLSKIFGELMMLLEADKRGTEHQLQLTYADSPDETFHIPENVHLIGTMNTADRSLSLVDYALRRRFAFVDLEPEFDSPKFAAKLTEAGASPDLIARIIKRMNQLNEAISSDHRELGKGYQIGHSFFCPTGKMPADETWYRFVVLNEIAPLLSEYWIDEPVKVESAVKELLE